MRCEEIEKLMPGYISEDISDSQRQLLEQHLSCCAHCQNTFDTYKEAKQQLSSLKDSPIPPDFTKAAMTKVKAATTRSRSRQWLRPALAGVAAVIILAILLVTQPWGLSPQSVMARAYAATEGLQSYRMSSTVTSTFEGRTVPEAYYEIAYIAPDRYSIEVGIGGEPQEIIIIGDLIYRRGKELISAPNLYQAMSQGLPSSFPNKENTMVQLEKITDLRELPSEDIDGIECLHYSGRLDMVSVIEEQKAALDPSDPHYDVALRMLEEQKKTEIKVELWVGKEDYIIRQIKQEQYSTSPEAVLSAVTKYHSFNQLISIEPPLDASGKLLPGWQLIYSYPGGIIYSYPGGRVALLASSATSTIGGEDPAHQQISYRITITNRGEEVAGDVRVKILVRATNDESGVVMMEAEPVKPGQVDLGPGESETYNVSWEYDASNTSKEELARLVDYSRIFTRCTTPEGVEDVQVFSTGAVYPLKNPPTQELVAQYEQARQQANFLISVPTRLPKNLELSHVQAQAMPDGRQMLILTYGDPGSQHIRFSQRKFDIEMAENGEEQQKSFEEAGFSRFTIMNISGYWKQGVLCQTDIDDPSTQYWDMSKIQMFWDEGDMTYQLTARDVPIEELMIFAASMVKID